MKKHDRPFEYFLEEIESYADTLHLKYQLMDNDGERLATHFYMGQVDAIHYILSIGARIFRRSLNVDVPQLVALSHEEAEALAKEYEEVAKRFHKKRGYFPLFLLLATSSKKRNIVIDVLAR